MKRITIPAPQSVIGSRDGQPTSIALDLPELLETQVWILPHWRTGSSDLLHMVIRLAGAFKGKKEGDVVDVTDIDLEHLVKAAMMSDKIMSGPNLMQILTLLCALTDAKDVGE